MFSLLEIGLSNALAATLLALLAAGVGSVCRRPALVHSLWLLVLLKLITPPLLQLPVHLPTSSEPPGRTDFQSVPHHQGMDGLENRPTVALQTPPADESPIPLSPEPGETAAFLPEAEFPPLPLEDVPLMDVPESPSVVPEIAVATTAPAPPSFLEQYWRPLVLAVWLIGSVLWLGLVAIRVCRFSRLLRYARLAPPELQWQAARLARRMELAQAPKVWLVPGAVSPMLWTIGWRPRLLLPVHLLDRLTEEQRDTILAHELAHLRRRDHWVRCLELLVTALYWWHPVVWWGRRQLREAEEQCCDAWVVWALPRAARTYALALVETVEYLSEARPLLPPAASGIGHVHLLKRRLTMIMQRNTARKLSWAGVLLVLGLGAMLLPWLPTLAQDRPGEPERRGDAERPRGDPEQPRTRTTEPRLPDQPAPGERPRHPSLVPPRSDAIEEAREAVELLEVQLRGKRAQLVQTEAKLKELQHRLDVAKEGRLGISKFEADGYAIQVQGAKAEVEAKQAEVQEAEIRLRQGKRRLDQIERAPRGEPGRVPMGPTGIGVPMGGAARPGGGAGIAAPPSTGAPGYPPPPLQPGASPPPPRTGTTPGGPGASPMPPARGSPTPAAPGVGIFGAAGAGAASVGLPGAAPDHERRLVELEKKLDLLLKELESLKRERAPGGGRGPGGRGGTGTGSPERGEAPAPVKIRMRVVGEKTEYYLGDQGRTAVTEQQILEGVNEAIKKSGGEIAVVLETTGDVPYEKVREFIGRIRQLGPKHIHLEGAVRGDAAEERGAVGPAPADLQGLVKEVGDDGLVTITIGSDDGLSKDQTLEVFRLEPKPMYLGVIKIIELKPNQAVGRLVRAAGKEPVQPKDRVAARLSPAR